MLELLFLKHEIIKRMVTFLRGEKPERLLIKEKGRFLQSAKEKKQRGEIEVGGGGGGVMAISSVDMCR